MGLQKVLRLNVVMGYNSGGYAKTAQNFKVLNIKGAKTAWKLSFNKAIA